MSLDLNLVVEQVARMASRFQSETTEWRRRLEGALETLTAQSPRWRELEAKRQAGRGTFTFLAPELVGGLAETFEAPPLPPELTVFATDGSHVDVDRHVPISCYLLNIGAVKLVYGPQPQAMLKSQPHLSSPEELSLLDPQSGAEEPVAGPVLAAKRTVEECRALAALASEACPELAEGASGPTLGLLDGSLILWNLASREYGGARRFVREELLVRGLLPALEETRRRGLALASYISKPQYTEVVNVLRLALCPLEPPNCDRCRADVSARGQEVALSLSKGCQALAGVLDRHLFWEWLRPGQRSALFLNCSRIVQEYYGPHRVAFFYLRLEEEVARVEVPLWVEEQGLLGFIHAGLLQQCRLGMGYPAALAQAHEQAVLTPADRGAFWNLVERELLGQGLEAATSAKRQSKRAPWI